VLTTLLEKKLVTTAGRKAVVGTPFLYRTTREFLVRFGLNELEDLPKPEELDEDLAATVEGAPAPVEAAAAIEAGTENADDDVDGDVDEPPADESPEE
jgi:segregation and condensation protein B